MKNNLLWVAVILLLLVCIFNRCQINQTNQLLQDFIDSSKDKWKVQIFKDRPFLYFGSTDKYIESAQNLSDKINKIYDRLDNLTSALGYEYIDELTIKAVAHYERIPE